MAALPGTAITLWPWHLPSPNFLYLTLSYPESTILPTVPLCSCLRPISGLLWPLPHSPHTQELPVKSQSSLRVSGSLWCPSGPSASRWKSCCFYSLSRLMMSLTPQWNLVVRPFLSSFSDSDFITTAWPQYRPKAKCWHTCVCHKV